VTGRKPARTGDQVDAEKVAADEAARVAAEAEAARVAADQAAAEETARAAAEQEAADQRAAADEAARLLATVQAGGSAHVGDVVEASDEEIEVEMLITITGLRNGEPWPAVGGSIALPAAEATQCIANGYAKPVE
jgi:hypothetical protein